MKSYILRIVKEEWCRQVFSTKRYFLGVPRRWNSGDIVFLVHKTEEADSLVGYGIIKEFVEKKELPEDERRICEEMRWRGILIFNKLYRIDPPVPVKDTVLSAVEARGKYLHGYPLTDEQVKSILRAVKAKASLREAK
ncbi:hypothetical protein CW706_00305 [Candidatus Bathyarchaeota archaeon]|nr:MAG: hypothetical protein CW706_00305 [Candidatus Bathyarchaeota archaeon]